MNQTKIIIERMHKRMDTHQLEPLISLSLPHIYKHIHILFNLLILNPYRPLQMFVSEPYSSLLL